MFRKKIFSKINIFLITFLISLSFFGITYSTNAYGIPSTLSYTGKLTDGGGNALGGGGTTYYFKFSIWDSSTPGEGNKLWPTADPQSTSLTVKQGSFSVNIGDTDSGYPDALDYDFNTNQDIYLQVELSSDDSTFETLAPRSKLSSNAFSHVASRVNGTDDSSFGTTTPFLNTLISAISTATNKAVMTIKGMAGQVANLFNITDSNDNILFTVSAEGKVGIGTTTPAQALGVVGNIAYTGQLLPNNGTAASPAILWNNPTSQNMGLYRSGGGLYFSYGGTASSLSFNAQTGGIVMGSGSVSSNALAFASDANTGIYSPSSDNIGFSTNGSERLRIDSSGNVGIGTTTPGVKLDVWGNLQVGTSSTPTLSVNTGMGNVSIGRTNSTNSALEVYSTVYQKGLRIDGGGVGSYLWLAGGNQPSSTANKSGIVVANGNFGRGSMYFLVDTSSDGNNANITDDTKMMIDYTTGNVGIGTSTPSAKLSVTGTSGSTADLFTIASSTEARVFTIANTGTVSIEPAAASGVGTMYFYGKSSGTRTATGYVQAGGWTGGLDIGANSGALRFVTSGTNNINFESGAGGTQLGRWLGTGNLGVGTTTPSAKIHVYQGGGALPSNIADTSPGIIIQNNAAVGNRTALSLISGSSGLSEIDFGTSGSAYYGFVQYSPPLGRLALGASGSPILYVQGGTGAVGVGTSTPSAKLSVTGSSGSTADLFALASSTEARFFTVTSAGNVGIGTSTPTQKLSVVGNAQFTAIGTGVNAFDIGITDDGTLTTSASDERLKENILTIDSASTLEKISQLKPSSFDWKSNNSHDIGLIAQEVEQIFPELVFVNPTDGYKGINYSRFITLLISGVQELNERVNKIFTWFKDDKLNIQNDVCVDDVCVTKEEFKSILQNNGGSPVTQSSSNSDNSSDTTTVATTTESEITDDSASSTDSVATETTDTPVSPDEEDQTPEVPETSETQQTPETPVVLDDTSTSDTPEETTSTPEPSSEPDSIPTDISVPEVEEAPAVDASGVETSTGDVNI